MHQMDLSRWKHHHDYLPHGHRRGEQQTLRVIALTATMMVAEILAGIRFGSMALLADGWHMASHASALGITAFSYWYARRHAADARYSFGTWKVGVLGGYTSAVVLAVIALLIAWESFGRFFQPVSIRFDEAIVVAFLGLGVNLLSAWMLRDGHAGAGLGPHHDHNLRAAYLHVLADALTSATAIVALTTGKYLGWLWMDPAMGIVGSLVITRWSYGLLGDSSSVLLDGSVDQDLASTVRAALESDDDAVATDLHIWRVGPLDLAAAISVVAHQPRAPEEYRERITAVMPSLRHVTLEVNRCES